MTQIPKYMVRPSKALKSGPMTGAEYKPPPSDSQYIAADPNRPTVPTAREKAAAADNALFFIFEIFLMVLWLPSGSISRGTLFKQSVVQGHGSFLHA